MNEKPTVLLAEDEGDDVFMMRRAVRKLNEPVSLQVVKDGVEAIEYLSGHGQFAERILFPIPSLILLDIKMPRKSGFEVMEWLRANGPSARIPVVMLTSSKVQSDVQKAFDMGAIEYLVKPPKTEDLQRVFARMHEQTAETVRR